MHETHKDRVIQAKPPSLLCGHLYTITEAPLWGTFSIADYVNALTKL